MKDNKLIRKKLTNLLVRVARSTINTNHMLKIIEGTYKQTWRYTCTYTSKRIMSSGIGRRSVFEARDALGAPSTLASK